MSKQPYFNAERYVQFRPDYPTALFNDIYKQVDSFELAWDCGCGNGQTALALAKKFNKVIAADISAAQIAKANPQNNIEYHVESYDTTKIKYNSINLLTVSQAMHWFEPDAFYANVQRVLVPAGTLHEQKGIMMRMIRHKPPRLSQHLTRLPDGCEAVPAAVEVVGVRHELPDSHDGSALAWVPAV